MSLIDCPECADLPVVDWQRWCHTCGGGGKRPPNCRHDKPPWTCGVCGPCVVCNGFDEDRRRDWCRFCGAAVCERCCVGGGFCSSECGEGATMATLLRCGNWSGNGKTGSVV